MGILKFLFPPRNDTKEQNSGSSVRQLEAEILQNVLNDPGDSTLSSSTSAVKQV